MHEHIHKPSEFPLKLRLLRSLGRQAWIPHGREKLLRLGCNPDTCDSFLFEVDFFGARYQGDLSHYVDWVVFMYGAGAWHELTLLKEVLPEIKLKRGSVNCFDIGANVGQHTLFMALLADNVFAFEPFAPVRSQIERKVLINGLNNVQILPFALGAFDQELPYFPGAGRNSGVGTLDGDHKGDFAAPINISVRNGDKLIDDFKLPRMDILKIDVEGFEPFVLRGLSRHIHADRPIILLELSEWARKQLSSETEFRELFYEGSVFAEVSGRPGCKFELRPFNYSTSWEVFVVPPEKAEFIETRLDRSNPDVGIRH
jgi:FkbM family methyltransferase